MAFPSVRSNSGGSAPNGTSPSFTQPAIINSGDLILILAGTDNNASFTVPSGYTAISQQDATSFQISVFGKVAAGTEGGTSVTGTLSAPESACYIALAIQDWSGDINDVDVSTIAQSQSADPVDPSSVTATWGADDNLFVAVAIADFWNETATGFPTGFTDNQLTQQHQNEFGGTQAVSLASKESTSATEDPDTFTYAATPGDWGAFTLVVKPAAGSGSSPTITDIDTDNAVNQYQQAVVNVSDFTETITSATLGGVSCTIPENDPADDEITIGVPGSLTTGTYDLVISGSSETDTLEGVSYTQTHARPAFDGLVDSNSILSGQSYTANTYFRFVTSFSNGTLDTAAGDADEWTNDIADYYTPDSEFTGDDTASIEFLYSDGTTSSTVDVTITVEGADETAPTITSASVPTSGDNIAVQMDESMQVGAGGSGGWTISLSGVSVTSAAVDGTDDTIINLTPSRTLTDEDTLTIGYTQPGNGFQDQADTPNDLATLSGQAVTNNSAQTPPDVAGPVTTSVTGPSDGSYKAGDVLPFTVAWDEVVFVSGTPAINFDMGGDNRKASYAFGSESDEAVFNYTVQPGDNAASGISVTSLTLDGGTIKDAADNDADLTLNSVADLSGALVDTVKPVISPVGGTTSTVVVGNSYTDAGATAFDDQDGSLGTVTGTGSVDTDTIGEYTITYPGAGVVDTAGNEADDATRTVNVVAVQLGVIGRVKQSRSRSNRRYPARV